MGAKRQGLAGSGRSASGVKRKKADVYAGPQPSSPNQRPRPLLSGAPGVGCNVVFSKREVLMSDTDSDDDTKLLCSSCVREGYLGQKIENEGEEQTDFGAKLQLRAWTARVAGRIGLLPRSLDA